MGFEDIKKYNVDMANSEAAKFTNPNMALSDKKPVVCSAYFSIALLQSTAHLGTLNIQEYIGPESPIKYHKIRNLVVYGFTETYKKKAQNDYIGFVYEKQGASLILSGIFEPMEGDFFISLIDNEAMLYIVTSAEELLDKDKTIYRIEHQPYCSREDVKYTSIENQVIQTSMYIHDNLGTGNKTLLPVDQYNTLINDSNLVHHLQLDFIKAFYKTQLNSFVCQLEDDNETKFYSPLLTQFLIDSQVLYNEKLSVQIQVSHESLLQRNFDSMYRNSLYGKYYRGKAIGNEDLLFTKETYKNEYFFSFFNKYGIKNLWLIERDPTVISNIAVYGYDAMVDNYLKDLRKMVPSAPNSMWDNIIADISDADKLKGYIEDFEVLPGDIYAYMLLPLVIYAIKNANNKVTEKPYDDILGSIFNMGNY